MLRKPPWGKEVPSPVSGRGRKHAIPQKVSCICTSSPLPWREGRFIALSVDRDRAETQELHRRHRSEGGQHFHPVRSALVEPPYPQAESLSIVEADEQPGEVTSRAWRPPSPYPDCVELEAVTDESGKIAAVFVL